METVGPFGLELQSVIASGGNVVCNARYATQEDVMENGLKQNGQMKLSQITKSY